MKMLCTRSLAMLLALCMVLGMAACGGAPSASNPEKKPDDKAENISSTKQDGLTPKGKYNEGVVLVKVKEDFKEADLGELNYAKVEPLYQGAKWYVVTLADHEKTEESVVYLAGLNVFEKVDYDYVMTTTAETAGAEVTNNPNYDAQCNLGVHNIPYGWTQNGKHPGGSPDVVVAIIDTGVDYNHEDLRNNIWINTAEIPNNGIDDDKNGYVDDVYGWDFVGNDKDPMDDNGHGTHVAGIVAAENNKVGGIGIAYGCKVMVLKAGNSSGYFNNSDIAEAIQYAYMNGASVINMSFGGSNISIAAEDALESAYEQCVLVAAAGNSGLCNQPGCCGGTGTPMYPAALTYVIGVMSTDQNGMSKSAFSNYDHNPYNAFEYEVYAVGEAVPSCWPNNKYAALNGTSMAAPTVAGVAALLRSYYADREVYATKFIQSQIINTGTLCFDGAHTVVDVYEAMTRIPKPAVNYYDSFIDDSKSISDKNNGNGVIDAGETIRLYFSLHNRGGVATDVNVSIDTLRHGEFADPYFTFANSAIQLSDIGTYSVRESGDKYFEIVVSPDCPNDYFVDFNIRFTYKNGLEEKDTTVYTDDGKQKAQFVVSRGYHLPATITEDTIYAADRLYIVGEDVVIPRGVTVTFEEGCEIQFYDDRSYYSSPKIYVYGVLNFKGDKDDMIHIFPKESLPNHCCLIDVQLGGSININYIYGINVEVCDWNYQTGWNVLTNSSISNSHFVSGPSVSEPYIYYSGNPAHPRMIVNYVGTITNCYFNMHYTQLFSGVIDSSYFVFEGSYQWTCIRAYEEFGNPETSIGKFTNNIVFTSIGETKIHNYSYECTFALDGCAEISNNRFINFDDSNLESLAKFENRTRAVFTNNTFSLLYQKYAAQIIDNYLDENGQPTVDVFSSCNDFSALYPYVDCVKMFDKDGNPITTIGKEEIKVRVTFNRPMDISKETYLTFGTVEPYADYRINGSYVSDTVWEGTYTLKAQIENGQNFLKVENACAAEDQTKKVFGAYQLHEFTIDTTAALSMNLQAVAKDAGIELTFNQDDYDTLLGYNIYRSESKDGNFVKLNPTILLPGETTFLDDNAEPGKTYWYTYTVVLSDFTESNPAGKVQATAKDTMAPSIYHTPVNQGYENNNLVISCTASDNVGIQNATLYYRAKGETAWKSLSMARQNDKFNATIFGSDVTMAGLEYYIVASDVYNTVEKGSAAAPYSVVIKSADSLLGKGDVDGNGAVTTKDALMLMQCLSGDLILSDDAFKRADLNGDGVLSSAEALRILQYINGKVNTLEM